jgi:hypothetical protein
VDQAARAALRAAAAADAVLNPNTVHLSTSMQLSNSILQVRPRCRGRRL